MLHPRISDRVVSALRAPTTDVTRPPRGAVRVRHALDARSRIAHRGHPRARAAAGTAIVGVGCSAHARAPAERLPGGACRHADASRARHGTARRCGTHPPAGAAVREGVERGFAAIVREAVAVAEARVAAPDHAASFLAARARVGEGAHQTAAPAVADVGADVDLAPRRVIPVAVDVPRVAAAAAATRGTHWTRVGVIRAHGAAGTAVHHVGRQIDAVARTIGAGTAGGGAYPHRAHHSSRAAVPAGAAVVVVGLRVATHSRAHHLPGRADARARRAALPSRADAAAGAAIVRILREVAARSAAEHRTGGARRPAVGRGHHDVATRIDRNIDDVRRLGAIDDHIHPEVRQRNIGRGTIDRTHVRRRIGRVVARIGDVFAPAVTRIPGEGAVDESRIIGVGRRGIATRVDHVASHVLHHVTTRLDGRAISRRDVVLDHGVPRKPGATRCVGIPATRQRHHEGTDSHRLELVEHREHSPRTHRFRGAVVETRNGWERTSHPSAKSLCRRSPTNDKSRRTTA